MPTGTLTEQILHGSVEWLRESQNSDGGWGHYGDRRSNVLNTAEVVLALTTQGISAGDRSIVDAAAFLKRQQVCGRDGPTAALNGAWGRVIDRYPEPKPDILRSAFCLMALNAAGCSVSDGAIAAGVTWLIGVQNANGGWGFTPTASSELFATAAAVMALIRLNPGGDDDLSQRIVLSLRKGLKRLTKFRNEQEPRVFGKTPELWIPHTLYALQAFAAARDSGFPTNTGELEPVYRWLNGEGTRIANFYYEEIRLENLENSEWNYRLTHYTPALYLAIVATGPERDDKVARCCYAAIDSNRVSVSFGSCGFAEKRPLAWATAKCITALSLIDDQPWLRATAGRGLTPTATAGSLTAPVAADSASPAGGPSLGMRLLAILLIIGIAGAGMWLQYVGKFSAAIGSFLIAAIVLIFVVLKLGRLEDLARLSPFGGKGSADGK